MIILDDGIPVCFHSLEIYRQMDAESVMQEIANEVCYTLLSVEAEYGYLPVEYILFWSQSKIPDQLCNILSQQCHADVLRYDLKTLPSLSEGLALRTAERRLHHVELVPREWIELQRRKRLIQIGTVTSIAVLSIWLAAVAVTGAVFSFQKAAYNRVRKEAARYEGPARAAQAAREEMLSLERYSDRSHSALECLREITTALPDGVEIASFTYKKGEAVSLRGSSDRAEAVYDFFQKLGSVEFFSGIKDQPINTRTVKEQRVSTFSVTAGLPKNEPEVKP
jgi:hypothetical protein